MDDNVNISVYKDNPYRNPVGVRYLNALFYEMVGADKSTVLYTLKDHDHEGYPSLYRRYILVNDLTEYQFAEEYLDGWDHWCKLCECEWFKPYVERWRKELILKNTSESLHIIQQEVSKGDVQAAKFILSHLAKEEEMKTKKPVGRPPKDAAEDADKGNRFVNVEEDFQKLLEEENE